MQCEKCNTEMVYFHEGASCGWTCPNCGNGVVTTYVDDVDIDETIYTITIKQTDSPEMPAIKLISKLCGQGFIVAKNMLINGSYSHEVHAKGIIDVVSKLKAENISYTITPEFPYDI